MTFLEDSKFFFTLYHAGTVNIILHMVSFSMPIRVHVGEDEVLLEDSVRFGLWRPEWMRSLMSGKAWCKASWVAWVV